MGAEGSCTRKVDEVDSPHAYPAGNITDYEEGSCKEVWITDECSVLVAMYDEKFYSIGSKCTHYGAPLGKGVYKDGMIRCPWHGACFDFTSGDIEDFPGLDSLPTYPVKVKNKKDVVVYVNPNHIVNKIVRPMVRMKDASMRLVIFGTGPAGFMCAQTLRQEGFDGKITMITKDKFLPYDRPKISKALGMEWEDVKLRDKSFFEDHDIEVMLNTPIGRIDLSNHKLFHEDNDYNEFMTYDKLVIASGLQARMYAPNVKGYDLKNIVKCAYLEDSQRIHKEVSGKKVIIIGSSFVAMELASCIKDKVESLTILSRQVAPYGVVFGETTGLVLLKYFLSKAKKAEFIPIDEVKAFEGNAKNEVTAVLTVKKKVLPCNYVIVAIGGVPNTEMFENAHIKMHEQERTIIVNKYMETSYKHTYAVGDIANFPLKVGARDRVAIGHWQVALTHGRVAALNLLGKQVSITEMIPFFWTSLCGVNIRYCGYGESYDESMIFGSTETMEFCTVFLRYKKIVAVCAVGCDPIATQMASAFEDQDTWQNEIPKFILDRFPNPPIPGDIFTGFRPKDDGLCKFDLKQANLAPRLIPEKAQAPSTTDLLEHFHDVVDDPVLPSIRERLLEMRREQLDRRQKRIKQRDNDEKMSTTRLAKWEDPYAEEEDEETSSVPTVVPPPSSDPKSPPSDPKSPGIDPKSIIKPGGSPTKIKPPAAPIKPSNLPPNMRPEGPIPPPPVEKKN